MLPSGRVSLKGVSSVVVWWGQPEGVTSAAVW